MAKLVQGDIFEINAEKKRYFQYIATDKNCLNGNVIKCFKYVIDENDVINLDALKNAETLFFLQTSIYAGTHLKLWKKIGNIPIPKDFEMPFFRHTDDVYSEVKKSYKWYIWQPNKEKQFIGELRDEYKALPYAVVYHPIDVVKIIVTGKNSFIEPM